ncbi:MAG: class I SAM-dependent methyltransferase [Parasphingorhabdus sp.]
MIICPACRMCGETSAIRDLGPLPDSNHFAGTHHREKFKGGSLYSCLSCDSMQRHPVYSEDEYLKWYGQGSSEIWSGSKPRVDNGIISGFVATQPSIEKVLDIGCNCGDLLSQMPHQVKTFGIEPSEEARRVANGRGIQIVAGDISELEDTETFDCITAVDLIEHVGEPKQLFKKMLEHTKPSGFIIISTGNPSAKIWRNFLKNRFWYSSFAEHISFPSAKALEIWSKQNGAELVHLNNFKYSENSILKTFYQAVMQATFYISMPVHRFVVNKLMGQVKPAFKDFEYFVPCSGLFRDHQIVIIQKTI